MMTMILARGFRPVLWIVLTAALFCSTAWSVAADARRLPNIVIIFCDDLGYADVGCFGAKGYATPHLDRMASQGVRFTNFHVAQAVCSASRAGLLTGCYPNRIGIHGALIPKSNHGIADSEMTLGEVMKQRGYATGMAGKWHLGHHPQFLPVHHGFDEYLGLPYSNDMWPHHPETKPNTWPPLPMMEGDKPIKVGLTGKDQEQLTTQYTERAVRFIERNKERPFFFYLAHSMPHVPLYVSDKFRGKTARGLFGDVIAEIDWSVGQVLDALERCGVAGNTWVIFTSDNGPWLSYGEHAGSAGPLREGKGTAWEGGTRVPCIMRWPGQLDAGQSSQAMFMTIDLLPTLAKLIGAKLPEHKIDGLDVWPLITGRKGAKNPHEAYACYYAQNELQAVMSGDGRWKLQFPHSYRTLAGKPGGKGGIPAQYELGKLEQPELYDLQSDIAEAKNVLADHPDIMKRLETFAETMRADLGDNLQKPKRKGAGVREPGRMPEAAK